MTELSACTPGRSAWTASARACGETSRRDQATGWAVRGNADDLHLDRLAGDTVPDVRQRASGVTRTPRSDYRSRVGDRRLPPAATRPARSAPPGRSRSAVGC